MKISDKIFFSQSVSLSLSFNIVLITLQKNEKIGETEKTGEMYFLPAENL